MKIELTICDLMHQTIKKNINSFLILEENYLLYQVEFIADIVENDTEENELLWNWKKDVKQFDRILFDRKHITSIQMYRGDRAWNLVIKCIDGNYINFKETKKASIEPIYEAAEKYFFDTINKYK